MNKGFAKYKLKNEYRKFMNTNIWQRLGRHGFSHLANKAMNRKAYGSRPIYGDEWTNNRITKLINGNNPFMIARFGLTEMNFLYSYLNDKYCNNKESHNNLIDAMNRLCLLSGFFPNDLTLGEAFAQKYFESISNMDICGIWNLYMEDYILDKYAPSCELNDMLYLEPWNSKKDVTWSAALKDKKVLVIHPFEESIKKQYLKNKEIFKNKFDYENILPDFELKTIKAVQSLGGENDRYSNWFDALNSMVKQARNVDFDIAIIGCGAYGLPLAAEIKKIGRQAIHLGGATQLMFGIWGHRWDQIPSVKSLYNDSWIIPSADEKPRRADEIENGCYW